MHLVAEHGYLDVVKYLRCEDCEKKLVLPKQTQKVAMPPPYIFNHTVGVDVNYLVDYECETYMFFNMVCQGTGFQLEVLLRVGKGTPQSSLGQLGRIPQRIGEG